MVTLHYKVVMSAIGSDSPSHDTLQNDQLAHSEHVLLFFFVSISQYHHIQQFLLSCKF